MTNPDNMNEEIDPETLERVEAGNDWYGPCGCIEMPYPECPSADPGPIV
jgi:hypothetical protein